MGFRNNLVWSFPNLSVECRGESSIKTKSRFLPPGSSMRSVWSGVGKTVIQQASCGVIVISQISETLILSSIFIIHGRS